jgi:pimeloyl-ACP methyl ester carboxylesterase
MPTLEVEGRPLFYLGGPGSLGGPDYLGIPGSLGGPGSPAGAVPVVCLHGAGGSAAMWTQLHAALNADRPVYALDLPGHGRSAPLDEPITIERYAAVVRAFLDAAGLARAALVGHSMGGAIALMLALDSAARLAGLVLVGTGARLRVAPEILDAIPRDFEGTVERICRLCYGPAAPPEMVARGIAEMQNVPPPVLLGDFLACDRFDVRDRLSSISIPTLVVVGDQDLLTPPRYAAFLADRIPGARLHTVPGAGHMLPVEAPAPLAALLRPFLARL